MRVVSRYLKQIKTHKIGLVLINFGPMPRWLPLSRLLGPVQCWYYQVAVARVRHNAVVSEPLQADSSSSQLLTLFISAALSPSDKQPLYRRGSMLMSSFTPLFLQLKIINVSMINEEQ